MNIILCIFLFISEERGSIFIGNTLIFDNVLAANDFVVLNYLK